MKIFLIFMAVCLWVQLGLSHENDEDIAAVRIEKEAKIQQAQREYERRKVGLKHQYLQEYVNRVNHVEVNLQIFPSEKGEGEAKLKVFVNDDQGRAIHLKEASLLLMPFGLKVEMQAENEVFIGVLRFPKDKPSTLMVKIKDMNEKIFFTSFRY